jgi:glycosyltransferase involved in cell wall biosynthesis
MRISLYMSVQNGIYFDYHLVDMLKHHLPLVDEIVVNEGYSTDGTYEAIKDLDPKVKVFRNQWDRSDPKAWYVNFKTQALKQCTGDWCLLVDCDEFIPEWQFDNVRRFVETTDKLIAPMRHRHFYGNYKVYALDPEHFGWPVDRYTIHRNLPEMEIWGDGSNVWLKGLQRYGPETTHEIICDVHHFGCVRHAARLRQKWRTQQKVYHVEKPSFDRTPGFVFDWMPHRWDDPDFDGHLGVYEGPYIKAVRDNPDEFVRDNWETYERLRKQQAAAGAARGA